MFLRGTLTHIIVSRIVPEIHWLVKYKLKNEGSAKYELAVLVTLHCAVADMLISKNKSAFIRCYTHQGTPRYSYLVGISYIYSTKKRYLTSVNA